MIRPFLLLAAFVMLTGAASYAPATPARLTGTFYGTIQIAEYESALVFDADLLAMDRDAIIKLSTPSSAAVAKALDGLTMISMVDGEAVGKRIRSVCSAKCRITGTIEELEPNNWYFRSVTAVAALPESYDFSAKSAYIGPAPAKRGAISNGVPPRTVGRTDPLRSILLEALHPAIERDLGQPVQFVVRTLRTQNDWAFATLTPQTKAGGEIDFSRTRYAGALREGMFERSGTIYSLLQKQGDGWVVRTFVVGATDVAYEGWPERYGAPYPLFGLETP